MLETLPLKGYEMTRDIQKITSKALKKVWNSCEDREEQYLVGRTAILISLIKMNEISHGSYPAELHDEIEKFKEMYKILFSDK